MEGVVKAAWALGQPPYKTLDPFLFAVYHKDLYPAGNNDNMFAPRRGNGQDFDWSAPYRMYHGTRLPGFPQHPHRGFETITLVQEGTCDHTDSLGAAGRYGGDGRAGDVQWMTAGRGVVHGEVFPLRHTERPNTLRLFQIWLNLPAVKKMADPGYVMLWAENMPFLKGSGGAECEVAAGSLGGASSGPPPPDSWAADAGNDVGVFYATLPPGSSLELPAAAGGGAGVSRVAYVVEGPTPSAGGGAAALAGVRVGGAPAAPHGGRAAFQLDAARPCLLEGPAADAPGAATVHVLVLQGRPIGEPVAQSGPFVMNTRAEVDRAFDDYSRTRFGGWPWAEDAVAFDRAQGRFADVVPPGGGAKRRLLPPGAASEAEL